MDEEPEPPQSTLPVPYNSSSPLSSLPSRPPSSEGSASPLVSEFESPYTDDNDDVDSAPPRKRKKGCPSSTAISASVRATVIRKAGGKCWLCGLNGVHIAHVIARSETILFDEYRRSGLLHMDSPNELQNLMFLCAGCHSTFDARVLIWAFLPIDLDAFISHETAFHLARAHAASLGVPLSRPDPWNSTRTALRYGRYQIRLNHLHDINFLAQSIKRWLGNPIAAILHSVGILSGLPRLDPVTRGGLPEDVARKFHELMLLYGVPPPPVQRLARTLGLGGRDGRPSDTLASPELPHGDHTTGQPPNSAPPNAPRDTADGGTTRRPTKANDVQQYHMRITPPRSTTLVRRKRCRHGGMSRWVFGPNMTSNMLIQWSMDSLENEKEDEAERRRRMVARE